MTCDGEDGDTDDEDGDDDMEQVMKMVGDHLCWPPCTMLSALQPIIASISFYNNPMKEVVICTPVVEKRKLRHGVV